MRPPVWNAPCKDRRVMNTTTRFRIAALLALAGCGPAPDADRPAGSDTAAGIPDTATAGGEPVCLAGGPFVADGDIAVSAAGPADARQVGAVRHEPYEGCERVVIDLLGDGGTPAVGTGDIAAEVVRELGLVRVTLRAVQAAAPPATDTILNGDLAHAAYTVLSPDGRWVWVDVHLADAAEARVSTLDDPGRVVVDLRPGGQPLREPPARDTRVVVLEPRPGATSYPLAVTGYARTFEANVVMRLEQDGEDVFEDFTTSTGWAEAWGWFSITVEEGPTGDVVLRVGEYSARDGTWEGVAIRLTVR
jgi:hypothetical protein